MSRARDLANLGDGIDTSSITSGTFADARIPDLATSKITSGTFADARIAQSNVTQHESAIDALGTVTSGTFNGTIGTSASGFTGIKMFDNWRLIGNQASLATPMTANLERNDTFSTGLIGSGMTVSNGIWTFPQTGIYLIGFHPQFYLNNSAQYVGFKIVSVVSGSTTALSLGYGFINRTNSASTYNGLNLFASFDVTDTSTHKIRFDYSESHSQTAVLWGNTHYNGTHFTFMRLGDT